MSLHTILGANGTIATELVPLLLENNEKVRLVSRNPNPVDNTEIRKADVLNYDELNESLSGSSIVYLLVGMQYDHKIWERDWPLLMSNVIKSCKENGSKLIFFDNVYMYGKVEGEMREDTPFNPCSKKGKVRAEIDRMLLKEMKNGTIEACIARAADFYGPRVLDKSVAGMLVFENLRKGKAAQWMVNADVPHSLTYTPDAARGVYTLAKHPESFGQVWHLPTSKPALSGRELVKLAASYMNAKNKLMVMPGWMVKLISFFTPVMKEIHEMNYQHEFPYIFSSEKFEKTFNVQPTPYETGVKETAEWFMNK